MIVAGKSEALEALSSARILFVDDSEMMHEILYTCLKSFNVPDVVATETSEQCLEELHEHPVDALILDWKLKDEDGLELARLIRRDLSDPIRRIPIILCTGYTERERVIEARDSGINEILCKPFKPRDLYFKLTSAMLNQRTFVVSDDYVGPERRAKKRAPDASLEPNAGNRTRKFML